VATHMLGKQAGVISGSALLVDYVLTITVSVVACVDALFSFLPLHYQELKIETSCGLNSSACGPEHPRREGIHQDPGPHLHPVHRHARPPSGYGIGSHAGQLQSLAGQFHADGKADMAVVAGWASRRSV